MAATVGIRLITISIRIVLATTKADCHYNKPQGILLVMILLPRLLQLQLVLQLLILLLRVLQNTRMFTD